MLCALLGAIPPIAFGAAQNRRTMPATAAVLEHSGYARSMDAADYAALLASPERFLDHDVPEVRRLAVATFGARDDATAERLLRVLEADSSPRVRAEAAEALGRHAESPDPLLAAGSDSEGIVREAVATG